MEENYYKIVFFVPTLYTEKVKEALFQTGAGKIGNYDCCSFEVAGVGQFRPLAHSRPFLGQVNHIEKVPEMRVEMVCAQSVLKQAIKALKSSHPYETPAFDIFKLDELTFKEDKNENL